MMDQCFAKEPMDVVNKTLCTCAAYNAGPARVQSLRKAAATRGLDPNVWCNNVAVVAAEKVGSEPVTDVSNIYKYSIASKRLTEDAEARRQACEAVRPGH